MTLTVQSGMLSSVRSLHVAFNAVNFSVRAPYESFTPDWKLNSGDSVVFQLDPYFVVEKGMRLCPYPTMSSAVEPCLFALPSRANIAFLQYPDCQKVLLWVSQSPCYASAEREKEHPKTQASHFS